MSEFSNSDYSSYVGWRTDGVFMANDSTWGWSW